MAFVKVLALSFICVAYVLSVQAADLPPHPPRPPKPAPQYPPEQDPTPTPEQPSQPPSLPAPPEAQQPQQGCYNNCQNNGQVIQRSAYVNYPVSNNYINLTQVLNLGPEFEGYQIVSVEVTVRGGIGGSSMSFLVHGQVHGNFFNPYGVMSFAPQYPVNLSCQNPNMFLAIQGTVSISTITINLRAPIYSGSNGGGYQQAPGY